MYYIDGECFNIVDGEIVPDGIFTQDDNSVSLEYQQKIAIALLEEWWQNRTFTHGGQVFPMTGEVAAENERALNRALATRQNVKLVTTSDKSAFVPVQDLVIVASAINLARSQSMDDWDCWLDDIQSGSEEQVVAVIKELLALRT